MGGGGSSLDREVSGVCPLLAVIACATRAHYTLNTALSGGERVTERGGGRRRRRRRRRKREKESGGAGKGE